MGGATTRLRWRMIYMSSSCTVCLSVFKWFFATFCKLFYRFSCDFTAFLAHFAIVLREQTTRATSFFPNFKNSVNWKKKQKSPDWMSEHKEPRKVIHQLTDSRKNCDPTLHPESTAHFTVTSQPDSQNKYKFMSIAHCLLFIYHWGMWCFTPAAN